MIHRHEIVAGDELAIPMRVQERDKDDVVSTITILPTDTVQAVLVRNNSALSTVVTVDVATPAAGSDLVNGLIIVPFTAVESATWVTGACIMQVKVNGVTYSSGPLEIVRGFV